MRRGFFKSLSRDEMILGGVLVVLVVVSILAAMMPGFPITRDVFACQVSGYGALSLLAISMLLGPLLRAGSWLGLRMDMKTSLRITRNTGIASALAALAHAAIAFTRYMEWHWREIWEKPYLHAGLLALVILVLLLIGSVKQWMSLARWQLWKPFFRLSLAAALLALWHMLYAPFASLRWTLGLYAAALGVYLFRFLPLRRLDAGSILKAEAQNPPDGSSSAAC